MNFFALDLKKLITGLIFTTLILIAINMDSHPDQDPFYLKPFTYFAHIIQGGYAKFSSGIEGTTKLYLNLIDIKKDNRELLKKNASLRAQLGAQTELQLENLRLSNLLGFKKKSEMELLAAKVIGRDLIPDHQSITINRGSNEGIELGMGAITEGGIVGHIIRLEKHTSTILLLTDRYGAVDSIVQRSRARGITRGFSKDTCQLLYLQRDDDVAQGDLVVSSGLDNTFPKGFPIGSITQVKKKKYGISQEVYISPTINPFALEEIFIVLKTQMNVAADQ